MKERRLGSVVLSMLDCVVSEVVLEKSGVGEILEGLIKAAAPEREGKA
jgi:hypothetical protein